MKKAILYILLFSYTTIMLKPVMPYVYDLSAHIFFYSQHMATVHYENGKLHVHQEMADDVKKTGSGKEMPVSKKDNAAADHIFLIQKAGHFQHLISNDHCITAASALFDHHLPYDYPPPRA